MIIEGRLVDPDFGVQNGQVEIIDGVIRRVGDLGLQPDLKADDDVLIFPGFVDVHVHLRQGDEYKEDYSTAMAAALNGGVTAMLDMPNNPVPPVDRAGLEAKRERVRDLPVDIDFYMGVGPGTQPDEEHLLYKAFMGPSIGPLFFHDDNDLEEVIRNYTDKQLTFHCEDPAMLREYSTRSSHNEQRPVQAEWKAVETAIALGQKYGFKVHVAHMTSARSLQLIEAEAATCEATPHHLFFDWSNVRQFPRADFIKMNPPLRSREEREQLLEAFLQGRIHFLATDHAPHTVAEKSTTNPSGVPHLDTYGAFVTWLMQRGFTPLDVARHCSELPGSFMRRPLGRIQPGYRGHLTLLAPNRPWTVRASDLKTKCGWSPFEGVTLPGRVTHTVASGRVFREGAEL